MEFDIMLRTPYHKGGFAFEFTDKPNCEQLIIYCVDRENDLIEGISHEVIEATVYKMIQEFGFNPLNKIKISENLSFTRIQHLLAIYSLPYYSVTKQYKSLYESLLKEHKGVV